MTGESNRAALEENKDLARRYLELISAGDARAVADLFTDDGAIRVQASTPFPTEIRGRQAIYDLMSRLPTAFPETGLKIIVDEVTAEGDRVAIASHTDAIHANGKPYRNRYHFLIYVDGGRIRESVEYLDSQHLNDVLFGDGAEHLAH